MTNANSFHSAIFVLLIFAVIYFVALGIIELKNLITKIKMRSKEHSTDKIDINEDDILSDQNIIEKEDE